MYQKLSFDLTDKVIIITGAGRGMGVAMAHICAQAGADLALGSRTVSESEKTAAECRQIGRRAEAWPLDLTDLVSIRTFVDQTVETFGRIDVLVNNAGYNTVKAALEYSEEDFDTIVGTNLKGAFFAATMVARHMVAQKIEGSIINITSQAGVVGGPRRSIYTGSMGGLNSITKSLGAEWAQYGITVNAIAPTFTRTPMLEEALKDPEFRKNLDKIPMGRLAKPEEIAAAVVYLASDAARAVTGHTLLVDGGFTAV